jgi:hypothetical protein
MPNPPEPHPESSDTLWTEHLQGCLRCRSLTEAVHAVCVHVDTREAELRSLLAYTTDKTADGRPRLSREFWELLLTKIGMAVMESVWEIMTLALRDKLPDIDLFRISLAEGAPKMCHRPMASAHAECGTRTGIDGDEREYIRRCLCVQPESTGSVYGRMEAVATRDGDGFASRIRFF